MKFKGCPKKEKKDKNKKRKVAMRNVGMVQTDQESKSWKEAKMIWN